MDWMRYSQIFCVLVSFACTSYEAWANSSEELLLRGRSNMHLETTKKFSFILPSFVIHGVKPSEESAQLMPRRIDDRGASVATPGLGFEYFDQDSGFVFISALIKDCYDHFAGALQFGSSAQLARDTFLGLSIGVYIRETPIACRNFEKQTVFNDFESSSTTESFAVGTECILLDGLSQNFMSNFGGDRIDIIPMPFVQFSTALYKSKDLQIDLKIMSNYFLNEIAIGVPF